MGSIATRSGRRPRKTFYERNERAILGLGSVMVFFVLWELVSRMEWINPRFISAPSLIVRAAVDLTASGELWEHLQISLIEFVIGFGLAILVGVPVGIVLGWYRKVKYLFDPFVAGLYTTPMVALIPLFVIYLGVGIWSKVAVIFLAAVFPVAVNIITGMTTLDVKLLNAARSFGATDSFIFRTVALPAIVPFFLSGLRLGLARGLVGIVIGELYAAAKGIGYLISVSGTTFQIDRVFVGVAVIAGAGIVLSGLINRLEGRFEAWRPQLR